MRSPAVPAANSSPWAPLLESGVTHPACKSQAAARRVWRDRGAPQTARNRWCPSLGPGPDAEPRQLGGCGGKAISHVVVGGSIDAAIGTAKGQGRAGWSRSQAKRFVDRAASALVTGGGTSGAVAGTTCRARRARLAFMARCWVASSPTAFSTPARCAAWINCAGGRYRRHSAAAVFCTGDEPGWAATWSPTPCSGDEHPRRPDNCRLPGAAGDGAPAQEAVSLTRSAPTWWSMANAAGRSVGTLGDRALRNPLGRLVVTRNARTPSYRPASVPDLRTPLKFGA